MSVLYSYKESSLFPSQVDKILQCAHMYHELGQSQLDQYKKDHSDTDGIANDIIL